MSSDRAENIDKIQLKSFIKQSGVVRSIYLFILGFLFGYTINYDSLIVLLNDSLAIYYYFATIFLLLFSWDFGTRIDLEIQSATYSNFEIEKSKSLTFYLILGFLFVSFAIMSRIHNSLIFIIYLAVFFIVNYISWEWVNRNFSDKKIRKKCSKSYEKQFRSYLNGYWNRIKFFIVIAALFILILFNLYSGDKLNNSTNYLIVLIIVFVNISIQWWFRLTLFLRFKSES